MIYQNISYHTQVQTNGQKSEDCSEAPRPRRSPSLVWMVFVFAFCLYFICICIQDRAGYHEALADLKAALEDASLDQVDLNIQFLLLALKVNKSQMIGCQI